jgi:uncharacterized protein (TIGR03437 family)
MRNRLIPDRHFRSQCPVSCTPCGFWIQAALLLLCSPVVLHAANPALNLRIVAEDTPATGTVQVKIYAAQPAQIGAGALTMDFDPAIFGAISNVAVFSSAGDAQGYAHVSGQHIDAHFTAPSGGIGQLPGMPICQISIPVLPGVRAGATSAITLDPTGTPANTFQQSGPSWADLSGNLYTVTVSPTTFHVGGTMSVQTVTPGGGVQPQGTVIRILGTGFDTSTSVTIDNVAVASTQLVSPQEIDVMPAGTIEMTGRRVHVGNIDYFASLPSTQPGAGGLHVLVPLQTYSLAQFGYPTNYKIHITLALQNPTLSPVIVTFFDYLNAAPLIETITIPPGGAQVLDTLSIRPGGNTGGNFFMSASAPIRIEQYVDAFSFVPPDNESVFPPIPLDPATANYIASPGPLFWNWQQGTPAPQPQTIQVTPGPTFTVSVSPAAQKWLTVAPLQGSTPVALTFTPNVASLAAGSYTGTVTVTSPLPAGTTGIPAPQFTALVALNVLTANQIYVANPAGSTSYPAGPNGVQLGSAHLAGSAFVNVASTGGAVPFTASVTTQSGGNWLVVTPTSGATPATITVAENAGAPMGGPWLGQLTIKSATNTLTVPIQLNGPGDPSATPPPILAALTNAGSFQPFALAPGEIVSLFGTNLGAAPATFTLDPQGHLPTALNGTQVLIAGQPAPLLYTSAGQINAIVPYEVPAGAATVQVVSSTATSATWQMPVAPSAPGLFTLDGGLGPAAVVNQDGSINGPSNPAPIGTVIQLYATGGGQTDPASATGSVSPSAAPTVLPVTVTIGGLDAPVQYHGAAPTEVAGLIQINAVIPTGAPADAVPVIITVAGRPSPPAVSLAVR